MIFEPSWVLQIGEQQHQGVGLLYKPLWPLSDTFDLFSVTLNGTQIIVKPKEAKLLQNLRTIWEGARGKLIWFRRMQMMMETGAPKHSCACYGIGLDVGGKRIGYRLFADGRVESGI